MRSVRHYVIDNCEASEASEGECFSKTSREFPNVSQCSAPLENRRQTITISTLHSSSQSPLQNGKDTKNVRPIRRKNRRCHMINLKEFS